MRWITRPWRRRRFTFYLSRWWLSLCRFSDVRDTNAILHASHEKGCSPVCKRMWIRMAVFWANVREQYLQLQQAKVKCREKLLKCVPLLVTYMYRLSPVCNRMWLLNEFGRPNCLPHVSHVYDFVPEWQTSCSFRSVRVKNPLAQTWKCKKKTFGKPGMHWLRSVTLLPGTHAVYRRNGFSDAFGGRILLRKISYKFHIDALA